jgi:hypothetical protein
MIEQEYRSSGVQLSVISGQIDGGFPIGNDLFIPLPGKEEFEPTICSSATVFVSCNS